MSVKLPPDIDVQVAVLRITLLSQVEVVLGFTVSWMLNAWVKLLVSLAFTLYLMLRDIDDPMEQLTVVVTSVFTAI